MVSVFSCRAWKGEHNQISHIQTFLEHHWSVFFLFPNASISIIPLIYNSILYHTLKVAVENSYKGASKLSLAVAWESLAVNPLQPFAPAHALFHLLSLSFFVIKCFLIFVVVALLSSVWTEMKWLQGKLQQSKLVRLSSSSSRLTVSENH